MAAAGLVIAIALGCQLAAAAGPRWSQAEIIRAISARFGPAGQAATALCVADRESDGTPHHFDPAGVNGGQAGLFQIDRGTWDPFPNPYRSRGNPAALPVVGRIDWRRIFEPAYNALVAYRIWRHSGWLPAWTADREACGL